VDSVNHRRPPLDDGALLREVTRLYARAQRETVACCGARTAARCHVLGELARSGPLRLTELARRVGADKSWTSRTVSSMAAEGLLACVGSEGDGRVVNVELTRAGRATWEKMDAALRRHAQGALERLPPRDRALVQRALVLLRQVLDEDGCCTTRPRGAVTG
jgi:DNA-binding MarR family transcriptional regulator